MHVFPFPSRIFVGLLKTKSYIAVILTVVFIVKFIAVDANGLNILFSGSHITFVNPHCEKNMFNKESNDASSFSQQDPFKTQMVVLPGNCTSPFQIDLFSWDAYFLNPMVAFDEHFPSRLSYRYLDSVSPPPRLL